MVAFHADSTPDAWIDEVVNHGRPEEGILFDWISKFACHPDTDERHRLSLEVVRFK